MATQQSHLVGVRLCIHVPGHEHHVVWSSAVGELSGKGANLVYPERRLERRRAELCRDQSERQGSVDTEMECAASLGGVRDGREYLDAGVGDRPS